MHKDTKAGTDFLRQNARPKLHTAPSWETMEEKNGRETAPSHCHNSPFKHEKPDLLNSLGRVCNPDSEVKTKPRLRNQARLLS